MTPKQKQHRELSDAHKAAMAEGRAQGRAVRRYLEALDAHRPRRGRRRTPASVRTRLDRIDGQLSEADPLRKVQLVQERMDLQHELDSLETKIDLTAVEADFVAAAKGYSERKRISYAAWREVGVPASVLKDAGISRAS